jgi:molybdenum cofactor cytidylyltransferase
MPTGAVITGAVILAAGPSSRLGQPKQLLQINHETLVHRAARIALEAGCQPVIVVTGASAEAIAHELHDLPVTIASNPNWSAGMGASLRAGLAELLKADPQSAAAMFLVCDQPHLNSQIVKQLITTREASSLPMAACRYAGTIGPPCCFDRSMFPALATIADTDGAKSLLRADPLSVVTIDWPQGSIDLDTPDDLKHLSSVFEE